MATSTLVSIDHYLKTVYRPDVEFIDGELKEKPVVQWAHVRLQSFLCAWFDRHEDEWGIIGGPEARTRVSQTRVRLPDIVMIKAGPSPQTLVDPPMIVIEIVSPTDSPSDLEPRLNDFIAMGVPNVWVIDPDKRSARAWNGSSWVQTSRLTVPDSPVYVDVEALFARLDKYGPEVA
jgi:Uma2 family endonuclease